MDILIITLLALCLFLGFMCGAFIHMHHMLDYLAAGNEVRFYSWNGMYYVIITRPSGIVASSKDKNMYYAIYLAHSLVKQQGDDTSWIDWTIH